MTVWAGKRSVGCGVAASLVAASLSVLAQGAPGAVKPGLWDVQASVARVMALPPEAEARIAALPAAQQAQVRAMMGGSSAPPMVTTRQVCFAGQANMDSLLNQAQQSAGMQCSFTNRVQTATGASYDMSCTGAMGSAKGHTAFHKIDADHITGTSHMVVSGNARGTAMNMTVDSTTTGKFVNTECGDVKPAGAPAPAN